MTIFRRTVVVAGAVFCALILAFAGILIFRASRQTPETVADTIYFDRELLITELEYRLPDVEERLVAPRLEYLVDPDMPLPLETVDRLRADELESLYDALIRDIEEEIEELIGVD